MSNPSVSVIIPVYERLELLRQAVGSVLAQTYPFHELVIVDDASPVPITLDGLGIRDSRVRIVRHSTRTGAAGARQTGVERATGELIAFLDSDDFWFRDKLESQVRTLLGAARENAKVAVVCGWQYDRDDRFPRAARMPLSTSDLVDFASGCWFCPGSTLLMSRQLFQSVGPFDPRLQRLEDFDWFLRFSLSGGSLLSAPVVGAAIRKGQRAKLGAVNDATRIILGKYSRESASAFTSKARRHLRAWLHVEQANAARNESCIALMAYHLARSMILVPRTSVAIRSWWTLSNARPPVQQPVSTTEFVPGLSLGSTQI